MNGWRPREEVVDVLNVCNTPYDFSDAWDVFSTITGTLA